MNVRGVRGVRGAALDHVLGVVDRARAVGVEFVEDEVAHLVCGEGMSRDR